MELEGLKPGCESLTSSLPFSRFKASPADAYVDMAGAFLHENRGVGPLPRSARKTRRALGVTLRICTAHTELWQALDRERDAKL